MGKKITYLFLACVVLFSCKNKDDKFKGYSKTMAGLYYKLEGFNDGKEKPSKDMYLKLSMIYKTENDSVFLDTQSQNPTGQIIMPASEATNAGLLGDGIMNMHEGDSMSFMLDAGNLFEKFFKTPLPMFLTKQSMVKVNIKLADLLDKKEYDNEMGKYEETLDTWDVEEQRRVKKYIDDNKLTAVQLDDGMYYINLAEGKGAKPDSTNSVVVNYSAYFMNGRLFDSTYGKAPFEFKMGEEFQVIWGLQQGIKLMKEGGKAKFIIPSYLAFGEEGSSTGIVPPFATVIYEVELIKVK